MGVLNVTPDSFSDGGAFVEPERALQRAREMVEQGAAIVDLGGESTRPGARPVPVEVELKRVDPLLERFDPTAIPLSIDTYKAPVAAAALEAGAIFVNDVTGLRGDAGMAELVAEAGCEVCLVHMLGSPRTMQENPRYDDVVSEVKNFLEDRLDFAIGSGIAAERIWLDPGIGFGKTLDHNLALLRRLDEIVAIGQPVLVGASRKRFIGALTGKAEAERGAGTTAANLIAYEKGATMVRVHDVAAARDALAVATATLS
jgi:dihydropteroate synthase